MSTTAHADPALAEAAFREGRRLLAEGQLAAACDQFAESQRQEPSAGALLNLARCHADAGMTATAWAEYLEAARLARAQERAQQAAEAELRASELEPRLVRLRVDIESPAPGLVVTRNGEPVAPSEFGQTVPVDPGRYYLRASAPGRAEWTTTVLLARPEQVGAVTIPALAPLPSEPPAAASPSSARVQQPASGVVATQPTARAEPEHRRIPPASWVAAGVGTAAFTATVVLAFKAKAKWDDAFERGLCDAAHHCNQEGYDQTEQARRLGDIATGCALVGVAAFTSAFLFYSFDASHERKRVQLGVAFGRASAQVGLHGGF